MRVWSAIRAYAAHSDSRASTANALALIVASNQPFYPLYLLWTVGTAGSSAWTFLSTPFFLAVPAVTRRHPILGRAMLSLVGIANTVLCVRLFGTASGVECFLLPCIVIAAGLFRPGERAPAFGVIALAGAIFLLVDQNLGPPVDSFTANDFASLVRLNAVSAGCLTALVGLMLSGVVASFEQPANGNLPDARPAKRQPLR